MQEENEVKNKLKGYLSTCVFIVVIGFSFYYNIFRTTNEIGYLGVDKTGRQIFIQTLDAYFQPLAKVDSDFYDHNFLYRILIEEPMRTTIRFDIQDNEKVSLQSVEDFMDQPYENILREYRGKVSLRNDWEVDPQDLDKSLKEKDAKTMEDFLAGFGFRRLQVYQNDQHIATVEIRGTKNVEWAGGE